MKYARQGVVYKINGDDQPFEICDEKHVDARFYYSKNAGNIKEKHQKKERESEPTHQDPWIFGESSEDDEKQAIIEVAKTKAARGKSVLTKGESSTQNLSYHSVPPPKEKRTKPILKELTSKPYSFRRDKVVDLF